MFTKHHGIPTRKARTSRIMALKLGMDIKLTFLWEGWLSEAYLVFLARGYMGKPEGTSFLLDV